MEFIGRQLRASLAADAPKGAPPSPPQQPQQRRPVESPRVLKPRPTGQEAASIFVGNLSSEVSEELLREMVGEIVGADSFVYVRLGRDMVTGQHRGFAHIGFPDKESAEKAVNALSGYSLLGRALRIDLAANRRPQL